MDCEDQNTEITLTNIAILFTLGIGYNITQKESIEKYEQKK